MKSLALFLAISAALTVEINPEPQTPSTLEECYAMCHTDMECEACDTERFEE